MLPITAARYGKIDQYPILHLTIFGRETKIGPEWKPAFYEQGIVFLGADFGDLVPPIVFFNKDEEGRDVGEPYILEGFTKDPVVFKLMSDFWDACDGSFQVGPVEIPSLAS